jgi:hypothetical protein|nr:MAG TPA: tail assembly chaperone protein [Caudoviricetes sp.]
MGDFSKITINNHVYKVESYSVMDAVMYHLEFVSKFGGLLAGLTKIVTEKNKKVEDTDFIALFSSIKPEETKQIINKVLQRVITPENVRLDNELVIQDWFSQPDNSHELWLVVVAAMVELLGEQLPATLNSAVVGLKSMVANLSTSQMDIEPSALSQVQSEKAL